MRREVPLGTLPPGTTTNDTTAAANVQGALIGRTTVVPNPPTNALIIRTAPPNFALLRETIESLDTRPAQVLFDVTVAEITLGRAEQFGIDWSAFGSKTNVSLGSPILPDTLASSQNFVVSVVSLDRVNVRAVLRALASRSQ